MEKTNCAIVSPKKESQVERMLNQQRENLNALSGYIVVLEGKLGMVLTAETRKSIEADIEQEVDQRMKDYPIRVLIDGIDIDLTHVDKSGGEINIMIDDVFCSETGRVFKLKEFKKWEKR